MKGIILAGSNGLNVRDWLYVEDHVETIDLIFHRGSVGETYCIGSNNEIRNLDLIKLILKNLIISNKTRILLLI